jgi:uncharacterized repeat protein (TIGR03803 family)
MPKLVKNPTSLLTGRTLQAAFALGLLCSLLSFAGKQMQAQTLTVIHNFLNRGDGGEPMAGVTFDRHGNLYGTTFGGASSAGSVFKMTNTPGGWVLTTLHSFQGGDGAGPEARVVFGPDGTLYGTAAFGGTGNHGLVFNLRPQATFCRNVLCPWKLTVIHAFNGADGSWPQFGDLIFDSAGNIYGTASQGGAFGWGVVFKLTHSGDGWSESVLYSFTGGNDGQAPFNTVTFDGAGNLYGTTIGGGDFADGTVYELSPSPAGWTETTLHSFNETDGESPFGGVVFDAHGNMLGTTIRGGSHGSAVIWQLTPSGGSWNFSLVHEFAGDDCNGPVDTMTLDAQGNLYGTSSYTGANGDGEIFMLSPSGGGWNFTSLHSFDRTDGFVPFGSVTLDGNENLYSTAEGPGWGIVWELTP